MPVFANPALVEKQGLFVVFTGVMFLGMHFKGNPEVADHFDPLFRPLLLFHCGNYAVVHLTEFFPREMLISDFVLLSFD